MSDNNHGLRLTADATIGEPEALRVSRTSSSQLHLWQKALLILGLLWALVVIVPDFYRLERPLATFGFSADNSGFIYDVAGKPATTVSIPGENSSGLRKGDRISLKPGACWHPFSTRCRDFLAMFGGMGGLDYVRENTTVTLPIMRADGRTADVTMSAQAVPLEPAASLMLALDEIAGVIVILIAFKLVWDRPGGMTLGFFLYAMWFNPGQYFAFYAWLQSHPILLLIQETLQALAQGAGFAGFLIFALRFPRDRREPTLQGMEQLAIMTGEALALLQLVSFTNVFGVPTEFVTRCAIFGGYAVSLCAFFIVWRRRKLQSPLDYQRMLWVLWGCAIGLPAFIFADSNEATSLWTRYVWSWSIWEGRSPNETIFEACYLVSGVLAIFICEAVRRPRIVNVRFELRGLAAAGFVLMLTAAAEDWMREPMTTMFTSVGIPQPIQFYAAIIPLVLFSVAAHQATHTADHFLNHRFYHAAIQIEELGKTCKSAVSMEEIDSILANGPRAAFHLASAAVYRDASGVFRLVSASNGGGDAEPVELNTPEDKALLKNLMRGDAIRLPLPPQDDKASSAEVAAPAVAVPVIFADELYAVAMYGPHETGADLDPLEVKSLEKFVQHVAVGYEITSKTLLESEVQMLRQKLAQVSGVNS